MALRIVFEKTLEVWDVPDVISIPDNTVFKVVVNSVFMGEVKRATFTKFVAQEDYDSCPEKPRV